MKPVPAFARERSYLVQPALARLRKIIEKDRVAQAKRKKTQPYPVLTLEPEEEDIYGAVYVAKVASAVAAMFERPTQLRTRLEKMESAGRELRDAFRTNADHRSISEDFANTLIDTGLIDDRIDHMIESGLIDENPHSDRKVLRAAMIEFLTGAGPALESTAKGALRAGESEETLEDLAKMRLGSRWLVFPRTWDRDPDEDAIIAGKLNQSKARPTKFDSDTLIREQIVHYVGELLYHSARGSLPETERSWVGDLIERLYQIATGKSHKCRDEIRRLMPWWIARRDAYDLGLKCKEWAESPENTEWPSEVLDAESMMGLDLSLYGNPISGVASESARSNPSQPQSELRAFYLERRNAEDAENLSRIYQTQERLDLKHESFPHRVLTRYRDRLLEFRKSYELKDPPARPRHVPAIDPRRFLPSHDKWLKSLGCGTYS